MISTVVLLKRVGALTHHPKKKKKKKKERGCERLCPIVSKGLNLPIISIPTFPTFDKKLQIYIYIYIF